MYQGNISDFGGGSDTRIWPRALPRYLGLRLDDVLKLQSCTAEDLWDETSEWLMSEAVQTPDDPPKDLLIRLASVLHQQPCCSADIWTEIRDWLTTKPSPGLEIAGGQSLHAPAHVRGCTKYRALRQSGSSMPLTRLIYTSQHQITDASTFDHILQKSQANNVRDQITGALIIGDTNFLQLLEGNRTAVGNCFVRIMQDARHRDIQIVSCGDANRRLFHEWSMHLINVHRIKREILSRYLIGGAFTPHQMSEFAIADLCRTLSGGNWAAEAA